MLRAEVNPSAMQHATLPSLEFPTWPGVGVHKNRIVVMKAYLLSLGDGGNELEVEFFYRKPRTFGSKTSAAAAVALHGSSVMVLSTLEICVPGAQRTEFATLRKHGLMLNGKFAYPACKPDDQHKRADMVLILGYMCFCISKHKMSLKESLIWTAGLFGALGVVYQTRPETANMMQRIEAARSGASNLMRGRISATEIAGEPTPSDAGDASGSELLGGVHSIADDDSDDEPIVLDPVIGATNSSSERAARGGVSAAIGLSDDEPAAGRNLSAQIAAGVRAHNFARAGVEISSAQMECLDEDAAEGRQPGVADEAEAKRLWGKLSTLFQKSEPARELGPRKPMATSAVLFAIHFKYGHMDASSMRVLLGIRPNVNLVRPEK